MNSVDDPALYVSRWIQLGASVNERHLRRVRAVYLRHFNTARPHRSLQQLAPAQAETWPPTPIDLANYRVQRRPILDGLTSEYKIVA